MVEIITPFHYNKWKGVIILIQIQAKENKCIYLGRRGEDSAREIIFDISHFSEIYGQGEAQVVVKREGDINSYPVVVTQTNDHVSWVVTSVDTDQVGYGQCELIYVTNNSVAKSIIYQTFTDESLSDPSSPPETPSIYGNIIKMLSKIPEIPSPTTDDNGKILGVTNGKYSLKNLPVYYLESSSENPVNIDTLTTPGKYYICGEVTSNNNSAAVFSNDAFYSGAALDVFCEEGTVLQSFSNIFFPLDSSSSSKFLCISACRMFDPSSDTPPGDFVQNYYLDTETIIESFNNVMEAFDNSKQDKITGTQGQVVGFDAEGNPIAQDSVGVNIDLDTTLSVMGKAADAKATGDAIAKIVVDPTFRISGRPADARLTGEKFSATVIAGDDEYTEPNSSDMSGYLRYQIVNEAPETYQSGVMYIVLE